MATKKEINSFLKENNYTIDDMQKFWDDCLETNTTVKALDKQGITWDKMNMSVIRELPTQKERDLKYIKEQNEKEKMEFEQRNKLEEYKKYYKEHFEEIIVRKIDNGDNLTEDELKEIVYEYAIDKECGDIGRWTMNVSTVVKLCNRYFMVNWEEGLTEMQDNEFYEQPYEVEKKEYEKTIKVTEWVKK